MAIECLSAAIHNLQWLLSDYRGLFALYSDYWAAIDDYSPSIVAISDYFEVGGVLQGGYTHCGR